LPRTQAILKCRIVRGPVRAGEEIGVNMRARGTKNLENGVKPSVVIPMKAKRSSAGEDYLAQGWRRKVPRQSGRKVHFLKWAF
jgi:hypothetical protein